jgi:hypothetical protein
MTLTALSKTQSLKKIKLISIKDRNAKNKILNNAYFFPWHLTRISTFQVLRFILSFHPALFLTLYSVLFNSKALIYREYLQTLIFLGLLMLNLIYCLKLYWQ